MKAKHVIITALLIIPSFIFGLKAFELISFSFFAIGVILISDEPKWWSNIKWYWMMYIIFSAGFLSFNFNLL